MPLKKDIKLCRIDLRRAHDINTKLHLSSLIKIFHLQLVHVCPSRCATLMKLQLRKVIRLENVRKGTGIIYSYYI